MTQNCVINTTLHQPYCLTSTFVLFIGLFIWTGKWNFKGQCPKKIVHIMNMQCKWMHHSAGAGSLSVKETMTYMDSASYRNLFSNLFDRLFHWQSLHWSLFVQVTSTISRAIPCNLQQKLNRLIISQTDRSWYITSIKILSVIRFVLAWDIVWCLPIAICRGKNSSCWLFLYEGEERCLGRI